MTKGFALNDERFINGNKYDAKYFDELLERIKTIRVSERMVYQKITDLFIAIAADYNPKSEEAYTFFKIVQNKLHYAISGHTAAELIYSRTNSDKEHMGLTNWKNSPDGLIYKKDKSCLKYSINKKKLEQVVKDEIIKKINIEKLDRKTLNELIDMIYIIDKNSIKIELKKV